MSVSLKKLWEVQLNLYPESVRLTPGQMLDWAYNYNKRDDRLIRFQQIAGTIQHYRSLFYITNPEKGYVGCRYGIQGHQYRSGFGWGSEYFRLVDGVLVEIEY